VKTYQCHKHVQADRVTRVTMIGLYAFAIELADSQTVEVSTDWYAKHRPTPGGYLVVYADGHRSFSPGAAFEAGYAEVAA
jgi:hypothetical protein